MQAMYSLFPRMGYVAGTLEDAYFKQIMVFLANAEPY